MSWVRAHTGAFTPKRFRLTAPSVVVSSMTTFGEAGGPTTSVAWLGGIIAAATTNPTVAATARRAKGEKGRGM